MVTIFIIMRIITTPWIHREFFPSPGGIFPFGFGGKAVFHHSRIGPAGQVVGLDFAAPVAESACLFPGYPYHRVIVKCRVPEITGGKGFIVRVSEIPDPA